MGRRCSPASLVARLLGWWLRLLGLGSVSRRARLGLLVGFLGLLSRFGVAFSGRWVFGVVGFYLVCSGVGLLPVLLIVTVG